ncbi:MAG: hypothetical protein ACK52P_05250 [Alphaproteobacteria bacterium]
MAQRQCASCHSFNEGGVPALARTSMALLAPSTPILMASTTPPRCAPWPIRSGTMRI